MIGYLQKTFALTEKGARELYKASLITIVINIMIMTINSLAFYFIQDSLLPILEEGPLAYKLGLYIGYGVFTFVLLVVLYYFQYNFCYISAYEESANMRISLAEALRKLPLSFFGKKDLADLTTTFMNDVTFIESAFSHFIPLFLGSIISTTIMGIGMFAFDYRLAIALTWVIPVSFFLCFATKKIQDRFNDKAKKIQINYLDKIQECIENVKDIKANNRKSTHLSAMNTYFDTYEKSQRTAEVVTGFLVTASQMLLKLGIVTTMIVGIILLASGEINLLTLLVFLMIASRIYDPLSNTLINLVAIFMTLSSVSRMKEFENTKVQTGKDRMVPNGFDICFKDVYFAYDKSETVLDGVSFIAKQGEITALVGPSGGGKSTAIKLAARFWDITSGKITLGGEDISEIDPETLLKSFSIVFQDVTLFNNTVMENIRIGKNGATDEQVIEAAKMSNCHEFVLKLPHGYNTLIGENGSLLSGGERQRISIARALLKDAPIILLDEATSSLDILNETALQEAISKLTKDKTVIVIAHRMRTVAGANKIILLKGGKVEAMGNHAELMSKSEDYKNMIRLQRASVNWSLKK